ncbi:Alpha/Beta hydrolase protein [Apodospora peruviana]|uniref:Alpha/Beta hydrolase protein n=1 Tax=Apodospora peruviana TaxID=516989 RepID=A0AAE0ICW5_9PEZI|nr:Alpha/Beta hydrolase protein [Apodospora peruviana]
MPRTELRFKRFDVVYKTVDGIPFDASALVPTTVIDSLRPARPVLVHFHGGAFIMGTALDRELTPLWLLQFAESRGAIVISPCYRLLPEATGTDILDDIKDFWDWLYRRLGSAVSEKWTGVSIDLGRIAVAGEGAGGTLALQSGLLWPQVGIKVVMVHSGALDPDSTAFNPRQAQACEDEDRFVTEYLKGIKRGTFRVSSPFPEHLELVQAAINTGRIRELLGNDEWMHIRSNLRKAKAVPAIWITQGADDSFTPKQCANGLVDEIRVAHPNTPLLYSLQPGVHAFEIKQELTEAWLQEGLRFVEQYW